DTSLELEGVEADVVGAQAEPAAAGDDAATDRRPEPGDVAAQGALGGGRRVGAPQCVNQRVRADMPVRMGGQDREDGALVRAGRRDIRAVGKRLERSEYPHVHDLR